MASLSCAISCCSEPPYSFAPHLPLRYDTVSSDSVSQTQLNHRLGLSVRPDMRIKIRKSPSHLLVSCLRDTKAAVVTHESWDKLILNSDTPVLVEFFTSWCGPCRVVHRVIEEIATDYSGRLKCFMLDADNDLQVAEDYDIKAVPVVLLFKNGKKCDSVIGTMPKEFYVSAVEKVLAS